MKHLAAALALAFSLSSVVASAAVPPQRPDAARHEKGDHGKNFPMKAAEFKQHTSERLTKMRARMEKHLTEKKVAEDKAKEIRAKFDAGVVRINEKVNAVCADDTVTKEEAKEVRAVFHEALPHGDKKHDKKHAKRGKK